MATTPKTEYSDTERALLTEEELAGLAELAEEDAAAAADDEDEPAEGTDRPAEKSENPASDATKPAADTTAAPSPGDAPPAAANPDKPADVDKPTDEEKPKATAAPAVLPKWQAPADVDNQISTIQTHRDELAQKFDEGEITGAEFRQQDRELEGKVQDLREQRLKASMSQESTVETWKSSVADFLSQPEYSIYENGSPLNAALDMEVRKLQTAAIEKGDNHFDPAILASAHENVQAQIRKAAGLEPAPKKDTAADPALGGRQKIPPTLGSIPASDQTPASDGGEYAAIDRLNGEEYEAAMAKLTPEQRDRYLAQ